MRKFIHCNTLLIAALFLAAVILPGCSDESTLGPMDGSGPAAKRILVLEDGGTEVHVTDQLRAAGFHVRSGGLFQEFTGDGLEWADAVVLLTGVDDNHDMDDRGETALVQFVRDGGGLMTTEWLCYNGARQDFHQILLPILPVRYADFYASGSETWTASVDHPITKGVASSFATPSGTQFSVLAPRSGATRLVRGSRSSSAVTIWNQGGSVVTWSLAGEYGSGPYWNADLEQLLVNTVAYISGR